MSAFNINNHDLSDNEEGSTFGVDMLFNQKKMKSPSSHSDNMSVKSVPVATENVLPRYVDLGESDDGDIEVKSRNEEGGNGVYRNHAAQQAFSEVTESDGGFGAPRQPQYSGEDILQMKRELLYQFNRLEKRGVQVPKKFSMSSSLDEMKAENDRLKRDMEVDASIKFQKRMVLTSVSAIEFLNGRFDPFDVHLDGWTESFQEDIDDYEEIFEALHDKYRGKAKIAPELRLLFGVAGSGFLFHLTHSMFKSNMPEMSQVFQQNPGLRQQFAEATMNTMQQNNPTSGAGAFSGLMNMFSGFGGGSASAPTGGFDAPPQSQQRTHMRGPTNVDDLLNELRHDDIPNNNDRLERISNASESDLTDIGDDASINGLLMSKKSKTPKRRTLEI